MPTLLQDRPWALVLLTGPPIGNRDGWLMVDGIIPRRLQRYQFGLHCRSRQLGAGWARNRAFRSDRRVGGAPVCRASRLDGAQVGLSGLGGEPGVSLAGPIPVRRRQNPASAEEECIWQMKGHNPTLQSRCWRNCWCCSYTQWERQDKIAKIVGRQKLWVNALLKELHGQGSDARGADASGDLGRAVDLLEDIKRLLILQLMASGVGATQIATALGVNKSTVSRLVPMRAVQRRTS